MSWIDKMNSLGASRTPFLFIIDYEMKKPVIKALDETDGTEILYQIGDRKNFSIPDQEAIQVIQPVIEINPVEYSRYLEAFNYAVAHQKMGYSYLLNLTFPSEIKINMTLLEVFFLCKARYKLYYRDKFVVFSPEIFVQIQHGKISSFPMKGTIDASFPGAEACIMNNLKEKAEHATIVDLIRNDLSTVATGVKVEKYRYIERLRTNQKDLLQVSSKITGTLPADFYGNLGSVFNQLLPAGSICGAPKIKTLELIKKAEKYERGFYTGIFGIFDGENLDSGVMIRFIEKKDGAFFYKSGGGITTMSRPEDEYEELINKIYVPVG